MSKNYNGKNRNNQKRYNDPGIMRGEEINQAVRITGLDAELIKTTIRQRRHKINRRSHNLGCVGTIYNSEILKLFNAAGWRCIYCGNLCTISIDAELTNYISLDHVFPLAHLNPNSIMNIVPCCTRCNNQKSEKPLKYWLYEIGMSYKEFVSRRNLIFKNNIAVNGYHAKYDDGWIKYLRQFERRVSRMARRSTAPAPVIKNDYVKTYTPLTDEDIAEIKLRKKQKRKEYEAKRKQRLVNRLNQKRVMAAQHIIRRNKRLNRRLNYIEFSI